MAVDTTRINRYRPQSLRLLDNALGDIRGGRWAQSEDLLWGSLTLAVKAVALSRRQELDGDQAVREYAAQLGRERRDKRIRESFDRLAASHRGLLAALDGVDEASFYRLRSVGHEEYSILSVLENETNHDREHAEQVQAILSAG